MDEQKISKIARSVQLTLSDEKVVEGELFLNHFDARCERPERVCDLINGEETFLPVKATEGVFLVNLARVVTVQVAAAQEQDDLMTLGMNHKVCVHTTICQEFIADIYVNLPLTSSRVKDYFNQQQRFFRLFEEDEIIYINPAYIRYLRD